MRKRLLSMFLVLCMVFTMMPIGAMAKETDTPTSTSGDIIAFAPLEETEKSVALGTAIEDLGLPESLMVTVSTTSSGLVIETERSLPVTWTSSKAYEKNIASEYIFTPSITGYTVSAELPEITVREGKDPLMMKLLGSASTGVYVGQTNVVAGTDSTYWISGDDGGIIPDGAD